MDNRSYYDDFSNWYWGLVASQHEADAAIKAKVVELTKRRYGFAVEGFPMVHSVIEAPVAPTKRPPPKADAPPKWRQRAFLAMVAVLPLHTFFLSAWVSWNVPDTVPKTVDSDEATWSMNGGAGSVVADALFE